MKEQNITVNTKGGLIAAFECAKDFLGKTNIKLIRRSGITEYILDPKSDWINENQRRTYTYGEVYTQSDIVYRYEFSNWLVPYNKSINKCKAKISKIPAIDLLS